VLLELLWQKEEDRHKSSRKRKKVYELFRLEAALNPLEKGSEQDIKGTFWPAAFSPFRNGIVII
jgi:hypothetical protein